MEKASVFKAIPVLQFWPKPGKILATSIIMMISLGIGVALVQVVVHDIIPTFSGRMHNSANTSDQAMTHGKGRGDLFSIETVEKAPPKAFFKTDKFIFALKFTHIHIFGMSGIFILMGTLTLFLDLSIGKQALIIALPFAGILIDLASVWLKLFIHPAFFWLHIPGGLMFGVTFIIEAVLMLRQMWRRPSGWT